jgi:endonuclease I
MATYSAQTWDLRLARVGNRKTCSMSISCNESAKMPPASYRGEVSRTSAS